MTPPAITRLRGLKEEPTSGRGKLCQGAARWCAISVSSTLRASGQLLIVLSVLFAFSFCPKAKDNGAAAIPVMGWNTWYTYQCDINECVVTNNAYIISTNGLKDAGCRYINLDDGFGLGYASRTNGLIQIDATKFPNGMRALGEYIHSLGLKFGVYAQHGTNGSGTQPRAEWTGTNWNADAWNYATNWRIDFLKFDNLGGTPTGYTLQQCYENMSHALDLTGNNIVLSIVNPPVKSWHVNTANSSRTSADRRGYIADTISNAKDAAAAWRYAGPGFWPDQDILTIGTDNDAKQNITEHRTQFSLVAVLASPILIDMDCSTLTAQQMSVLTNAEVIAIDQDVSGSPGRLYASISNGVANEVLIFGRKLSHGRQAVAAVNYTPNPTNITVNFELFGYNPNHGVFVRDAWARCDVGQMHFGSVTITNLASHATAVYVLTAAPPLLSITAASPSWATVSWAPNTTGFVLQETTDLSSSNWTDCLTASTNPVVVPVAAQARFYRLRRS